MASKIHIIKESELPLQITFKKASQISSIPMWTLRKYERTGKMPRGRRIGSRVYLNTKKFLKWLDLENQIDEE